MTKPKLISLIIAGIAGAIALTLIAFLIFINVVFAGRHIDTKPFEAEEWRRVGESDIRQTMVDDYLRNHNPVGMTRDEVVNQLGEPPETTYFRNYNLVYWVGIERGAFAIDSEWLVIKLDDQNVVTEAQLVTD